MPDLTVWPTDGADGSVSSEARWRKMARGWSNSGVKSTTDLAPTLAAGPTVNVTAGQCWVDGHFCELTAAAAIPVTAGPGLVVVRFTPADNHAEILYRDGVSVPVQTDPTYELPIAFMSGGAVFDRRALSVGGEAGILMSALTQAVTAINPTYGTLPGTTLPIWGVGQYVLTCSFDMEVVTAAAGNLAYCAPQFTGPIVVGPTIGAASVGARTFIDMNAARRDVRSLVLPVVVTAPAAAVVVLGACKGASTGAFQVVGAPGMTWVHARRIG